MRCLKGLSDKGLLNRLSKLVKKERDLTLENKSYRQVQVIVSRFNPMIKHRDITRPVVVRRVVSDADERQNAGANSKSSSVLSLAADPTNTESGDITLRRGGKKSSTDTPIVDSGL